MSQEGSAYSLKNEAQLCVSDGDIKHHYRMVRRYFHTAAGETVHWAKLV